MASAYKLPFSLLLDDDKEDRVDESCFVEVVVIVVVVECG